MFSIERYEPDASADVSSISQDAQLAAIRKRLLTKKRKREALEGEGELPTSERSVRFSDTIEERFIPSSPPEPAVSKPKTPAQQKLLAKKNKKAKERRKAKRVAVKGKRSDGAKSSDGVHGDSIATTLLTVEDEEEARRLRKERKARLKAERRQKKGEENGGVFESSTGAFSSDGVTGMESGSFEGLTPSSSAVEEIERDGTDLDAVEETPATGLQRLPRPKRTEAPDISLLKALGIAEELRDGVIIDPALTVEREDLRSKDAQQPLLSATLQQRLEDSEISAFFAVQAAVLPLLLESPQLCPEGASLPDLCVSAPTGSGKTLAYVLPIIEILCTRVVTRLRALIVLPTRDLAQQVREVFETFCRGTDLKVGTACGQHSLTREQEILVGPSEDLYTGGLSNVDILVATPGRLLDHLRSTLNFTLQHLRFLVIDEADRLVGQSFGEWLPTVLSHIETTEVAARFDRIVTPVAPQLLRSLLQLPSTLLDGDQKSGVQKLLFSATLSRDPAQISGLRLNRPIYIAVQDTDADAAETESFALPASLVEYMITSNPANKPVVLFHLLATHRLARALCFTKSIEAASRLVKLIELFIMEQQKIDGDFAGLRVASFASDLSAAKRNRLLDSFKKGEIQLLVCSDLIARGMDIPNVEQVVSYDVPIDMRKYVHRVGRTARAGRAGVAWSLVEKQEVAHFQAMLSRAGRKDRVKLERVNKAALEKLRPAYEAALEGLKLVYSR